MDIQKYLAQSRVVPHIVCVDGFTFSVQASSGHYCRPRTDDGPWSHVEVMGTDELLERYSNEDGISDHVPIAVVMLIIHRHGGFSPLMPKF